MAALRSTGRLCDTGAFVLLKTTCGNRITSQDQAGNQDAPAKTNDRVRNRFTTVQRGDSVAHRHLVLTEHLGYSIRQHLEVASIHIDEIRANLAFHVDQNGVTCACI